MNFKRTIDPLTRKTYAPTTKRTYTTDELAALLGVKNTTIHHGHCLNGHYMGVRPIKLPNRLLLWPANAVEKLLTPDL